MPDLDLFAWWAISITGGSIFLTLVSIYLYVNSKARQSEGRRITTNAALLMRDFIFVWVLLGLLAFYIISIQIGSAIIFAAGNILVEVILVAYLLRNKTRKSRST